MASMESARNSLAEARGDILTLMQEEDTGSSTISFWAEFMYAATERIEDAMEMLDQATLWE